LPPHETQVSIPQEDIQKETQEDAEEDTQKDMQQYSHKDGQEVKQEDTQENNQGNKNGSDIIVSRIPAIGDSEQVIIVSVLSASSYYEGDPKERWNSFEKLRIPAYKYAVGINYNVTNIEPGKGSAISLHIWQGPNKGTSGCTAVSEENMLKILKWLDPNKKPIIIQGTQSWINSLTK